MAFFTSYFILLIPKFLLSKVSTQLNYLCEGLSWALLLRLKHAMKKDNDTESMCLCVCAYAGEPNLIWIIKEYNNAFLALLLHIFVAYLIVISYPACRILILFGYHPSPTITQGSTEI